MKRLDMILLLGLMGAILSANFTQVGQTVDSLQQEVLRLHILANSDTEEDQALKYAVRDRLLAESATIFGDADTLEELYAAAESGLARVEELAAEVVASWGCSYPVHAELVNMTFNARTYDTLTMPAGTYDALRVTIGEAEGQNWWCVMYPPLCIPAAEQVTADEASAEDYFDAEAYDVLTNPKKYVVRFKCVEWAKKVKRQIFSCMHS